LFGRTEMINVTLQEYKMYVPGVKGLLRNGFNLKRWKLL